MWYTNTNDKTESHSDKHIAFWIASSYSPENVFIAAMNLDHISSLISDRDIFIYGYDI